MSYSFYHKITHSSARAVIYKGEDGIFHFDATYGHYIPLSNAAVRKIWHKEEYPKYENLDEAVEAVLWEYWHWGQMQVGGGYDMYPYWNLKFRLFTELI